MVRILALREQFAHMSKISGYDALYSYLPGDISNDTIFCNFKKSYPRGIGRLLTMASRVFGTSDFYNAQSFEVETKMLLNSFTGTYDLIHYTYGEPYISIGGMISKMISASIIITNHQPVSWWEKHQGLFKKYKNAAKVVALSDYDTAYFNSRQPGKAVCIPHGVNTTFYKPLPAAGKKESETFKVIFTGRYLRDVKTLASVIKKLSASSCNFSFDVVYLEQSLVWQPYLQEIMVYKNVSWHYSLTDDELLSLYQQADCMLLPLEDCTANNALLEGLACGLSIVTTDLPAIRTYLNDTVSILGRKGNADDLCDALIFLSKNETKKKQMAAAARKRAVQLFDWNEIAGVTADMFRRYA